MIKEEIKKKPSYVVQYENRFKTKLKYKIQQYEENKKEKAKNSNVEKFKNNLFLN
ncbi:hypothetical protein NA682_16590 [Salmonella sp. NW307]|uniref:hypothetical protein n=1 Tax=Salmonella TaxID=590 RepID=UPI001A27EC9C|nr:MULTISPECIES: hypothetical protein [Salmonella]MBJ2644986.1 hypothetical protein [Salmonella enterica subsp. enterica serovar Typhimurium]MBJ5113176.1 hypothetical protein [Salmonella enterica subsp. enterica serovar Corvallis]MDL3262296.1 hypothetical protein [Salmonella enterica]